MQFLYFLCKTFQKLPNDPLIVDMDPVHRMFFFFNWLEENNSKIELYKTHAYLIGGFINPQAVKSLLDNETISVSDENFEQTFDLIKQYNNQTNNQPKSKQRKIIRNA